LRFLPIEVKIASNSSASCRTGLVISGLSQSISSIISSQYIVSLDSLSQIVILFLKSALLRALLASL